MVFMSTLFGLVLTISSVDKDSYGTVYNHILFTTAPFSTIYILGAELLRKTSSLSGSIEDDACSGRRKNVSTQEILN